MAVENKKISFIIPHKGRFSMLKQTLASIANQQYPKELLEVIVISQTPSIEQQVLCDDQELKAEILICKNDETISALRNKGYSIATGEYLAFLDADVFISPDWIKAMLKELHQDPDRIITSAMQKCEATAPPLEKIRTALSNATIDSPVSFLPGRNLFMHRDRFDQIGGFPEHLTTCEDYYFTDKAAKIGTLYYSSSANYIHLGEDKELGEMFKKEIWRGQSNLQSINGRNIPLRELPSFVLPPIILFSWILASLLLLAQSFTLSCLFVLIGSIPLLAYSIRLYLIASKTVRFIDIIKFYALYFPARAIGTLAGLFRTLDTNHK